MIPLYSREAVRALDRDAIARLKVPGVVLMENAGLGATEVLRRHFGSDACTRVVVVGGTGQNGGDGWVLARHLLLRGWSPRCVLVGDAERVRGDALINLNALRALGLDPAPCRPETLEGLERELREATLVVDALFGTGLDRDILGFHAEVIAAINAAERPVLALDLPSGVDADTGQVRGTAVRARCTATFAAHKPGLHQYPGAELAGSVHCVPIGVPVAPASWSLIEARDVARLLPRRHPNAHKGTNGRVLVLAGSRGKTGAALLAATSALRAGAGLVTIGSDAEAQRALEQKVLEVMTEALSDDAPLQDALALASTRDAAVLGPGFGLTQEKLGLALELAQQLPVPTVLDADALTALVGSLDVLPRARAARVLTPHPGEAARLLGCTASDIERDRCGQALRLARLTGQVVVLKGARTVVASPREELRITCAGTPALGSAGTGDVLGGAIAALLVSQKPFDAAWIGVELHARAGALAAQGRAWGILASEVAGRLAEALDTCRASPLAGP